MPPFYTIDEDEDGGYVFQTYASRQMIQCGETDVKSLLEHSFMDSEMELDFLPSPGFIVKLPVTDGKHLFRRIYPNLTLDMGPLVRGRESEAPDSREYKDGTTEYILSAVICLSGHHYTSFIRSGPGPRWIYINSFSFAGEEVKHFEEFLNSKTFASNSNQVYNNLGGSHKVDVTDYRLDFLIRNAYMCFYIQPDPELEDSLLPDFEPIAEPDPGQNSKDVQAGQERNMDSPQMDLMMVENTNEDKEETERLQIPDKDEGAPQESAKASVYAPDEDLRQCTAPSPFPNQDEAKLESQECIATDTPTTPTAEVEVPETVGDRALLQSHRESSHTTPENVEPSTPPEATTPSPPQNFDGDIMPKLFSVSGSSLLSDNFIPSSEVNWENTFGSRSRERDWDVEKQPSKSLVATRRLSLDMDLKEVATLDKRHYDYDQHDVRITGIEGANNSCYMDSSLNSMFLLSPHFLQFIHQYGGSIRKPVRDSFLTDVVQKLYRNKRLELWGEEMERFRSLMGRYKQNYIGCEMDAEEFVSTLFGTVLCLPGFYSIDGEKTSYVFQTYASSSLIRAGVVDVQTLVNFSFFDSEIQLDSVPDPAFIVKLPVTNRHHVFHKVRPNLILDTDDLIVKGAQEQSSTVLHLSAVICLNGNHYTAFVRDVEVGDSPSPWLYLDSFSYGSAHEVPHMTELLSLDWVELDRVKYDYRFDFLLRNAYMCFYVPEVQTEKTKQLMTKEPIRADEDFNRFQVDRKISYSLPGHYDTRPLHRVYSVPDPVPDTTFMTGFYENEGTQRPGSDFGWRGPLPEFTSVQEETRFQIQSNSYHPLTTSSEMEISDETPNLGASSSSDFNQGGGGGRWQLKNSGKRYRFSKKKKHERHNWYDKCTVL